MSQEVIVIATFLAHPGKEEGGVDFLVDLLAETHAEPGCLLYAVHRGIDDPRKVVFVERWETRELLETHIASDHIQNALARVGEFFELGPEIVFYEAVPGGEDDKGSIAGHARAAVD